MWMYSYVLIMASSSPKREYFEITSTMGVRLPPTIFKSTFNFLSSMLIMLYEFANSPLTRSEVAVPAFIMDNPPNCHSQGLCLCPHKTAFTSVSSIVRSASPASVTVALSEPVLGIPLGPRFVVYV